MLTQKELIHYSRHIILPEVDEVGQSKLKESTVLIVGMGGLGSPVAMYLAAAGVGNLILSDHDAVEQSNLQRQIVHSLESIGDPKVSSAKTTLENLNPWIKITTIEQHLDGKVLDDAVANANLVVDCSDNYATRFALNESCVQHSKTLVSGTAIRFKGQVAVFNQTPGSACYHCLYQADQFNDESCEDQGILAPVVGVIGSLQATEVLKTLMGIGKTLDSRLLVYDGLNASFKDMKITKDPACEVCGL
ncbi:HesA/MoeB/ThiF family protein [Kangiella koreensis]|uniref:Molybdopterin-synthase adenylyltransferase n=1 Tax=Kangiella koreensis (strain DSM 16069 / JCM 12317 / KCTC 12182 / SW-125) TaxID=523791 RepID=C7RBK1_KANKD|nr:molybdopterin-synthase adenylyltransferase MoeB [Kangiella koreensis]ACV26643.1 UBA/THIF-type NAD/FAD binding protein [Kangiella koreensis DSM 16069]